MRRKPRQAPVVESDAERDDEQSVERPPEPREATATECGAYARFVELLTLSDSDRAELRRKRGFTDATIDACRFKSGGDVARRALIALREHVNEETIVSSGLFARREVGGTGSAEPNPALTSGAGIIPYFDDSGRCVGIKRHKGCNDAGYWLAGKRVELYVPSIRASNQRTLYVTEGEYKAAALAQLGFFAIAVPGITAFSGKNFERLVDWIRRHGTPSVVIVFDTEDKRERIEDIFKRYDTAYYAWLVAHQLVRLDIETRIATLPLDWDAKRQKVDPDSVLAAGKQHGDFEAVFQRAVPPSEYLRSTDAALDDDAKNVLTAKMVNALIGFGSPCYRLTLPDDSEQRTGCVNRLVKDADDNTKTTPVAHAPMWIAGIGESVETQQRYVRLAYVCYRHGHPRLETRFVARGELMNSRRLVELSDYGVPVDSSGISGSVSYLSALDSAISPYLTTERLSIHNGWHDLDSERVFILGDCSFAREGITSPAGLHVAGGESAKVCAALTTSGSFEEWRELARRVRDASVEARFVLSAGFAAPLLDICRTRSFGVHVYGGTGHGKTPMLKLAASVWGDTNALVATLHTTIVGIERTAALYCDLPVVFDELQASILGKEQRGMLAYLIAQGTGKTRGKANGGLQETARWRTVALTSGEQSLTTEDDFGGQQSRVIEVYVRDDEGRRLPNDLAREVHQTVNRLHGHAGREFLLRILKEDPDALRKRHRTLANKIAEHVPSTRHSVLDALGIVALADILAGKWLFPPSPETDTLDLIAGIAHDLAGTRDYGDHAIEWIQSWTTSHANLFGEFRETSLGGKSEYSHPDRDFAGVRCINGDLWILPNVFRKALEEGDLDERRVLKDWHERGWIETTPNEKHLKPVKYVPLSSATVDGRPRTQRQRVVAIRKAAFGDADA